MKKILEINDSAYFFDGYLKGFKIRYGDLQWFKENLIQSLNVSVRLKNVLLENGIFSFEDLAKLKSADIWRLRNLGQKTFKELRKYLTDNFPLEGDLPQNEPTTGFKKNIHGDLRAHEKVNYENVAEISCSNGSFYLEDILPEKINELCLEYKLIVIDDLKALDSQQNFYSDKRIVNNYDFYKAVKILKEPLNERTMSLLKQLIKTLTIEHSYMLYLKAKGKTLEEIGKEFGITRERVRQIIAQGLKKIKNTEQYKIIIYNLKVISLKKNYITRYEIVEIFGDLSQTFIYLNKESYMKDLNLFILNKDVIKDFHKQSNKLPEYIKEENFEYLECDEKYKELSVLYIRGKYYKINTYFFKKKPSNILLYKMVIEKKFKTIKINNKTDIDKFKEEYYKMFRDKSIYKVLDRAITGTFCRIDDLMQVDRGEYSLFKTEVPTLVVEALKTKVFEEKSMLISGLYEFFQKELNQYSIQNRYHLYSVLKHYLPKLNISRDYVSRPGVTRISNIELFDKLDAYIKTQKGVFCLKNVKKIIPGITEPLLYAYMKSKEKIINVNDKKFLPTSLLRLLTTDKEKIYRKMRLLTDANKIVSSQQIIDEILGIEFLHVIKENNIDNSRFAFNFIKYFFKEKFNYQGSCLSDINVKIEPPLTRLFNFFKEKKRFMISDIIDYAKDNYIYINSVKKYLKNFYLIGYLRLDNQMIVHKSILVLPEDFIKRIEIIIINSFKNKKLCSKEINTYENFPKIGLIWNEHLLAHLIKNYSENLHVIEHGNQYIDINYEFKERKNE